MRALRIAYWGLVIIGVVRLLYGLYYKGVGGGTGVDRGDK